MEKYFIAMLTEDESDSNLYYVKENYSIKRIKNDLAIQTHDKETLEEAKEQLKHLIRLNKCLRETYKFNDDTINALKIAYETIDDILGLYENN